MPWSARLGGTWRCLSWPFDAGDLARPGKAAGFDFDHLSKMIAVWCRGIVSGFGTGLGAAALERIWRWIVRAYWGKGLAVVSLGLSECRGVHD